MRRFIGLASASVLACSLNTGLASAGTPPGVHVDPGSPAAKEYAIPLGAARGAGGGAGNGGGSGSSQLFGSGITRTGPPPNGHATAAAPSTKAGHASRNGHSRGARRRPHHNGATGGAPATPTAQNAARVLGSSGSGGTGVVWMVAAAALVLVLGGFGGAALARRGRPTRPRAG